MENVRKKLQEPTPVSEIKYRIGQVYKDKLKASMLAYVDARYVMERLDDVVGAVDTVDMPFLFFPCFVAGLAYYISMKKAPERTGMLKQVYEEEFTRALSQDEPRTSLRIAPNLGRDNSA